MTTFSRADAIRDASDLTAAHNDDAAGEWERDQYDDPTPTRAEVERDEAGWDW